MKKKKILIEENWNALLQKSLSKVKGGGPTRAFKNYRAFNRRRRG